MKLSKKAKKFANVLVHKWKKENLGLVRAIVEAKALTGFKGVITTSELVALRQYVLGPKPESIDISAMQVLLIEGTDRTTMAITNSPDVTLTEYNDLLSTAQKIGVLTKDKQGRDIPADKLKENIAVAADILNRVDTLIREFKIPSFMMN